MLCSVCLQINIDEMEVEVEFGYPQSKDYELGRLGCKHYTDFHKLRESASRHCELCRLIVAEFDEDSDHIQGREAFFDMQIYCHIGNPRFNLPEENQGGSEFCVYWNLEYGAIPIARLDIYVERSMFHAINVELVLSSVQRPVLVKLG